MANVKRCRCEGLQWCSSGEEAGDVRASFCSCATGTHLVPGLRLVPGAGDYRGSSGHPDLGGSQTSERDTELDKLLGLSERLSPLAPKILHETGAVMRWELEGVVGFALLKPPSCHRGGPCGSHPLRLQDPNRPLIILLCLPRTFSRKVARVP